MTLLPLFDVSHLPDAAWMVDPPAPTGLLSGLREPIDIEEVGHAVADFVGESIELTPLEAPPQQEWLAEIRVPGLSSPLLFFTAKREEHDGLEIPITECPQLLGVESLLHPADPLTVYVNLVRLLMAATPDPRFTWDVITNRIIDEQGLAEAFLGDGTEPPDRVLWVTEAVETTNDRWIIQTRGLHRCGRAELAVAEVPVAAHQQALMLVDGLASLCLESPLPAPGQVIQVGSDLSVRIETAESRQLEAHTAAPTGIILDPEGDHVDETLKALEGSTVAMYRTARAGARETRQARETWSTFAAFAATSCDSIDCLVQVPFMPPDGTDDDTHLLWLRVVSSDGTAAVAELLHCPPDAVGLAAGDRHDIDAETISNWCIMLPEGPHGPESATLLVERLEAS
ncbi:MAG: hypothetical protein MK116_02915 [Phycisphaerales bacterium]|nr:hypothetical protein [Phycisphaerales bacterium]